MLIPSKSQLVLGSNDFTRSHNRPGSMLDKFSSVKFGRSGIISIGSAAVGQTDSDIVLPMLVKKELNSSAISCWSTTKFPFTVKLSIFLFFDPIVGLRL